MAKRTELYERHLAAGAKIVDFSGWELPIQYAPGPKQEHLTVRQAAGLFDIDHMGQVMVSGPDALAYLQSLLTADIAEIAPNRAGYALMCYDDGGTVDDVFVYNLGDRYMVAINASNVRKDTRWMAWHRNSYRVELEDISADTYMLALQGPASEGILQRVCADADLSSLPYHGCLHCRLDGVTALVGRTGYTGEDGFELYFPAAQATTIWDALLAAGASDGLQPIGLAARDSLRLEPCMPLYGQELSSDRTPIQAGLSWAVSFEKGAFVGRDALAKERLEGPHERLVAFRMVDRGVPRHGYPVLQDEVVVGEVTSGIYSPTLDAFIGLAYVPGHLAKIGTEVGIGIRGKTRRAQLVRKPFYRPAYRD